MKYIIAIDQGTTSSRCILYDQQANPVTVAQQEFQQIFPEPGWVEHDAEEIWQTQSAVFSLVMAQQHLNPADIAGIGITNQRETTVIWDRATGKPIYNAIVWQDRRTAKKCAQLKAIGVEAMVKAKTGLLIDAYFSATKICWILDHVDGARDKAARGELAFGTVDSWLIWNLSKGELHITDVTNAARTLLFNINYLQWDDELLELFDIPVSILPEVKSSSECYGVTRHPDIGAGIPIAAIAGDQQAALFGQQCFNEGMVKCTYGTGAFLIMNTGSRKIVSNNKLLTTIAWKIDDKVVYALEGSAFTCGALIQWLRDGLRLFDDAANSEVLAESVADNGGVVFVPALTGLAAPHWDPDARGSIFGITRGTTRGHIARAALEGICFQVDELLSTMSADTGKPITEIRIDGGATANNLLMQFQADISELKIFRPSNLESTALGAAYLAGLATGFWTLDEIQQKGKFDHEFNGTMQAEKIKILKQQWLKAVDRSMNWTG